MTIHTTTLTAKKAAIFPSTTHTLAPPPPRLVMTVRPMMPNTSSMMAAPRMALPERVESRPISFRVSTVILTEVAVSTTPINTFWRKASGPRLKAAARAKPPARGTSTPMRAMTKAAFPDRLSSPRSVSSPALNMSTMTPSSASWSIRVVSCSTPSMAGPNSRPASSAPTT